MLCRRFHLLACPSGYKRFNGIYDSQGIFKHAVAQYGQPTLVLSDRGPAFGGVLFKHMAKLFNITHKTSSATTAGSNALAKSCVKRVNELLKITN